MIIAVKVYSKPNDFGERKELANIPYDKRGLPIFDDVSMFTTKIDKPVNYQNMNDGTRRKAEMRRATLALRNAINKGEISKNKFTKIQLEDIYKGESEINGLTWHHNAQSGPNNMQLIPRQIHEAVRHIGEASLNKGK